MKRILSIGNALLALSAPLICAQAQTNDDAKSRGRAAVAESGRAKTTEREDQEGKAYDRRQKSGGESASFYDVGTRHALAGRHEEAIRAFQHVIVINPTNEDAYFSLGNVYSDMGRWAEAVGVYKQAIRLNPKDGEAYNNLGAAYFRSDLYPEAVEAFKQAIHIFPTWPEPHLNLSDAYYMLGQYEAATASYKEASRLRPNGTSRSPLIAGGAKTVAPSLNDQKRVVAAPVGAAGNEQNKEDSSPKASPAERADLQAPNDAKTYYKLGVKYGRAGRYKEAAQAFTRAVRIKPDYADAYFGLGHAYSDLGNWEEAIEAYQHVVRLNPKDEEAYAKMGEALTKLRAQAAAPVQSAIGVAVGESVSDEPYPAPSQLASTASVAPSKKLTAITVADGAVPASKDSTTPRAAPAKVDTERKAASAGAVGETDPTSVYRVGVGDVLDVRLLDALTAQSTLFTVTSGGLLDYPPLGEPLQVVGLTTDEITARLVSELKRRAIHESPKVGVWVREYASHTIMVSGLVNDAGSKILRREAIPLYVVIADAQLRPEAHQVLIVPHATGRRMTVNLADPSAISTLIYPGDVVIAQAGSPQFFYVGGRVSAPGQKDFHPGITLTQAIMIAGRGLSEGGNVKVKVKRQDASGLLTTLSYNLKDIVSGKAPDPLVQPDDRIEVVP